MSLADVELRPFILPENDNKDPVLTLFQEITDVEMLRSYAKVVSSTYSDI